MRASRKWPHRLAVAASLAAALGIGAAALLAAARPARAGEPRVVAVEARRFQFTPREIVLRRGEAVTLRLTSRDVTHGFFQRALGIDATIEPGKVTELTLTPGTAGRFLVICDHFCGAGHGGMNLTIVVEELGAGEAPR